MIGLCQTAAGHLVEETGLHTVSLPMVAACPGLDPTYLTLELERV